MGFLTKFFNFYIYSNLHVSLAVFCLTKITLLQFGITENVSSLFVFFATIISYNAIRFININKIRNESAVFIQSYKLQLLILNIICLIGLVFTAFLLRFRALLILFPFVIATSLYVSPFKIWKFNLRDISGLKLFLIAFSWAGVTVLFPLIQNELEISNNIKLLFLERFLFIVAITIPFDIRDIDYDSPKLFTLPQAIGNKKSKIIGIISLFLFFLTALYRQSDGHNPMLVMLLVTVLSSILIGFSSKDQSKYYSSFWLEGIPIIWFLLTMYIGP